MGSAEAIAHGAATLVNAIALGKGAAFGVDLWTKAEVTLTDDTKAIRAEITSDPSESTILIEKTVSRVLKRFGVENQYGAKIKTTSNIPVAKGLKSSSAAANAVVLSTLACLGEELDDLSIVNLGVDAAFDAKVTITGAFDDACASYFGGIVVTDNDLRMVVKRLELSEELMGLIVLFHVPPAKSYTANSNVRRLKSVASLVNVAYDEVLRENLWTALSLNGLIYSSYIFLCQSIKS